MRRGVENISHCEFDGLLSLEELRICKLLLKYKGRIVVRGDNVKDKAGYRAVFTEQRASASQMAAAKFLDTILKLPGWRNE